MNQELLADLRQGFRGEIATDGEALAAYSHDASLFEVKPEAVVFPRDEAEMWGSS